MPDVQKRGAAVIKARGASSAASAANAALDTLRSLHFPTPAGDWHSVAVLSKGDYGIAPGIMFGYPLRTKADGSLGDRAGPAARRLLQGEDRGHREGTARGARDGFRSPRLEALKPAL